MKKIILCFVIILCTTKSYSQFTFSAGPYVAAKVGVNISEKPYYEIKDPFNPFPPYSSDYGHIETGPTFDVPDFGASMMLTLTDLNLSTIFDVGYSSTSALIKYGENASNEDTYISRVNYFNIAPSLSFKGFLLGFNLGLPISANTSNESGNKSIDAGADEMNEKIELRLGGMIPIIKSKTGVLNVVFLGNFMFTGLYGDTPYGSPGYALEEYTNLTNPRVWTFSLGFNYLFSVVDEQ